MKNKLLLIVSLFILNILNAQDNNKYDLLVLSGTVKLNPNVDKLSELRVGKEEIINGHYFRIIQFLEIPTEVEKEHLKAKGVELLGYLPNFSFFAIIAENTDLSNLNSSANIRALLPVAPEYKLHPSLKNNQLPADAEVVRGKADLTLTYFKGIPEDVIVKKLVSKIKGLKILEMDHASQMIKVRIKKKSVSNLTLLSFIQYVEPTEKWKLENNSGTTEDRSNTINNFIPSGLRFNGARVGVSIGDGGAYFGHVDLTGRVKGGVSPGADHGTHVAGILAGAGNINPKYRGHAPGANLIYKSGFADISSVSAITTLYNGIDTIRITNHSLGEAVNAGYTSTARMSDLEVETLPSIFNVHSCGNSGSGWETITGGYKVGKNAIAAGNLDYKDLISSSSSRGPSADGRIKPDICTKGSAVQSTMPGNIYGSMSGTSMASPAAAGCFAQLIEAYRSLNAGADPKLALLKGIVLNTAEDLGNTGPDYTYGWGRINTLSAYTLIKNHQYLSGSIAQGGNNSHIITVPANTGAIKVMVYWADPAASSGVAKALINDLDIQLASSSQTFSPWKLNPASPSTPATQGLDRDNNMEQIVVTPATSGTYTLTVNGYLVPQGPQEYWVSYEFIADDIKVTYPMGGESFVPGETEYIRWEAFGKTGTFTIEYSSDLGVTWNVLTTTAAGTARYYTWTVPSVLTGKAMVRVSRGTKTNTSEAKFNIIPVPTALAVAWRCPTDFQLSWTAVAGATSYEAYLLGQKYMNPQGTTTNTNIVITSSNASIRWASVRALAANGTVIGRRAIAIQIPTATSGCTTDLGTIYKNDSPYMVSVYPNPIGSYATISLHITEEENISIKLIDICGKEIASVLDGEKLSAGEHQFSLEHINASGIYMLMVKGNKGVDYEKVIVTGM